MEAIVKSEKLHLFWNINRQSQISFSHFEHDNIFTRIIFSPIIIIIIIIFFPITYHCNKKFR